MSHVDGTLCPTGTHAVIMAPGDEKTPCKNCKWQEYASCPDIKEGGSRIPCWGRPDGYGVAFREGAKPRLVLLRKVEGGYADIIPPLWAKSFRRTFGNMDSDKDWKPINDYIWRSGVVFPSLCAYEFSSKSAEVLNREQ